MSGPPSRPTPPSKPQSVSHEGVTISGIRVGSVLQGTRSQDRWPASGRPRLGGHMSPGGSFALSASSSRSSGSSSAANRSRAGGRSDPAAQDKIQAAGSRSSSHRRRSGSKIQAWRSFSAGSCNEFSGAHVRSSRRAVSSGSEFKFSLRSSKSLSSSDKSLLSSVFEPDDVSIPRRQDSTLSVHLSPPKSPSGSVEYACAVSPPSSANVLPGSPLRRPVLETKVSARVVTTTIEFTPPAHAVALTSTRSGLAARASGEALESDTREGERRRSVAFTDAPSIPKVPDTSVRDGATVASVIPESKPEQPQEKIQLPEPKTTQPQQIEPRLGPPVSEATKTVFESSTSALVKAASEPSSRSEDRESLTVQSTEGLHYRWKPSAGHGTSMSLVLQDEPEEDATKGAARPQPLPAEFSATKEVPPTEEPAEENSAPVPAVKIGVLDSEPDYQPRDILSEHDHDKPETTDATVRSPVLSEDQLRSQQREREKLDASALIEICEEDRSIRAAQGAAIEKTPLFTGTLFGPQEEEEITEETTGTVFKPTAIAETSPSQVGLESEEEKGPTKGMEPKALDDSEAKEGSIRVQETEAGAVAEATRTQHIPSGADKQALASEVLASSAQEPLAGAKSAAFDEFSALSELPARSLKTTTAMEVKSDEESRHDHQGETDEAVDKSSAHAQQVAQQSEPAATKCTDVSKTGTGMTGLHEAEVPTKTAEEVLSQLGENASSTEDRPMAGNKVSAEPTVAAGTGEPESKPEIQLYEITGDLLFHPRTTGGLLEGDSRITDNAKPEDIRPLDVNCKPSQGKATKGLLEAESSLIGHLKSEEIKVAQAESVVESCDVLDTSRQTGVLVEVSKGKRELEATEETKAYAEGAEPMNETSVKVEPKDYLKVSAAAKALQRKTEGDIRPPDMPDEPSLHPRQRQGLLETDSSITEHVKCDQPEAVPSTSLNEACLLRDTSEEATALVEASAAQEKATEETKAHVEEAQPQVDSAVLVEHKAPDTATAETKAVQPEIEGAVQPNAIQDGPSLQPKLTGALLEADSSNIEHPRSDETKAVPSGSVAKPSLLLDTSGETRALVEVSEAQKAKPTEKVEVHAERAENAAKLVVQVEIQAPVKASLDAETLQTATKGESQLREIEDETSLHTRATGELLDTDSITECVKSKETIVTPPGSVAEFCEVLDKSRETGALVEVSEAQEVTASEEPKVHVQGAQPAAAAPVQEELEAPVKATAEAEAVHTETQGEIQQPEIGDERSLQPRASGRLFDTDSNTTERAKSEETITEPPCSVAEPCELLDESGETGALLEVSELQEAKASEQPKAHVEAAQPTAAAPVQEELKTPLNASLEAEAVRTEIKGDIQPPGIGDETSLHPRATGGLLDIDSSITERAKSEETIAEPPCSAAEPCELFGTSAEPRALVEVSEAHEAKAIEEPKAHVERALPIPAATVQEATVQTLVKASPEAQTFQTEAKGNIQPPEIEDQTYLHQRPTVGLLDTDSSIPERAKSEETVAAPPGAAAEFCRLLDISGETRALVEVAEAKEGKATDETKVHADIVEPMPAAQMKPEASVKTSPQVEAAHTESTGEIQPLEIGGEQSLQPRPTEGLLEADNSVAEHVISDKTKAATEGSAVEPCGLIETSRETRTLVEFCEVQEARATEAHKAHAEGAEPVVEPGVQVEPKAFVKGSAEAQSALPEGKHEIEPPEIEVEMSLHPRPTGGILDTDSSITEHAKSDETKTTLPGAVAEPHELLDKSGETRTLLEISEAQEVKVGEEPNVEVEGVQPTAAVPVREELQAPVKTSLEAETVHTETNGEIRPVEIGNELSLQPRVIGELLETDSGTTEHDKSHETKAVMAGPAVEPSGLMETPSETRTLLEVSEVQEARATEEPKAHAEGAEPAVEPAAQVESKAPVKASAEAQPAHPETKVEIQPPKIEAEVSLHPRPIEGLLETDSSIPEHAKSDETKPASPGSVAEPCQLLDYSAEPRVLVEVSEMQEAKATEEPKAYVEGAQPTAAAPIQEELQGAVKASSEAETVQTETKGGSQLPKIVDDTFLHPRATAGLLEKYSSITEHAISEETKAVLAGPAVEPSGLMETSREARTLVEFSEVQEARASEEPKAHAEGAEPAVEPAAQEEPKTPLKASAEAQSAHPETKVEIQPPKIEVEVSLDRRPKGGLLETDSSIPEHAKSDAKALAPSSTDEPCQLLDASAEPRALVEVSETHEAKATEELKAYIEGTQPNAAAPVQEELQAAVKASSEVETVHTETKVEIQPPEIGYEPFLQPRATGGLLETDSSIAERATSDETTAVLEGPAVEPSGLMETSRETGALVELIEVQEARKTEEHKGHAEGVEPAVEPAVQVEPKAPVKASAEAESAQPEGKGEIEPPEIEVEMSLDRRPKGGLLETDSSIPEHAKSDATKALAPSSTDEPCQLLDTSAEPRALVEVSEAHEAKATEEPKAPVEGALLISAATVQEEFQALVKTSPEAKTVEAEPKGESQPPEIGDETSLHPRATGGLLDTESSITEHAKSDETKAVLEGPAVEPSGLMETSRETGALVELIEVQEARKSEEHKAHAEGVEPAVELAVQVEPKAPVKASAEAESAQPEGKGEIEPPEIEVEMSLDRRPKGGLLETDSSIPEHAKSDATKALAPSSTNEPCQLLDTSAEPRALVEVSEAHEAKATEELKAPVEGALLIPAATVQEEFQVLVKTSPEAKTVEAEPKGESQPPEIGDETSLHPRATGGLLDTESSITEHAKSDETKAVLEGPAVEPSGLMETSRETRALVELIEVQEARKSEEHKAHAEGVEPAVELAVQVEPKAPVKASAEAESAQPEGKGEIEPPEIEVEMSLDRRPKGRLLETDSSIPEHAKSDATKALAPSSTDEPCQLLDASAEPRALVEVSEAHEAKATEKPKAPVEGALLIPAATVQEEFQVLVKTSPEAKTVEAEPKGESQPPEIGDETSIHPRATGGLLDTESSITEHAKSDETKAVLEGPAVEPSGLMVTSRETRALVELIEVQEARATEEHKAHAEGVEPAVEPAVQVEPKAPVKASAEAESAQPEGKGEIEPPEIEVEMSLDRRPKGRLLETDSSIPEHAKSDATKALAPSSTDEPCQLLDASAEPRALVEVSEAHEAKATEKPKAPVEGALLIPAATVQEEFQVLVKTSPEAKTVEAEPKGESQPPEIGDETSLHPRATGGLLYTESSITEHAKSDETKAVLEGPAVEPSGLMETSRETRALVELIEVQEARATEEHKAHAEGVEPAVEPAVQVEPKAPVKASAEAESAQPEGKGEIEPPEIEVKMSLDQRPKGGLLVTDSSIPEHTKSDATIAAAPSSIDEPCQLLDISAEPRALVEVSETNEARATEEAKAYVKGAQPTTASPVHDKLQAPVEARSEAGTVHTATKLEIQPTVFGDEPFLQPTATGGRLETDSSVAERAISDETKAMLEGPALVHSGLIETSRQTGALVEFSEVQEPRATEEPKAHAEGAEPAVEPAVQVEPKAPVKASSEAETVQTETKCEIRPSEIGDESFLQPRTTGGLLDTDSSIAELAISDEIKAVLEGPAVEPSRLMDTSRETRSLVEFSEIQESRATEEHKAHAEGAEPGVEPAAQAEQKAPEKASAEAQSAQPEGEGEIEPPESEVEMSLHPRPTGGLLDTDSSITEHSKSDETKTTLPGPVAEPREFLDKSGETRSLLEIREAQDVKVGEEPKVDVEGVQPTAAAPVRDELQAPVKTSLEAETVHTETKSEIRPAEIGDELSLQPRATGGLLEMDSGTTEHDKSDESKAVPSDSVPEACRLVDTSGETRALVEVAEANEAKIAKEPKAHDEGAQPAAEAAVGEEPKGPVKASAEAESVQPETKGEIRPAQIGDELSLHPRVTGGLLETDSIITERYLAAGPCSLVGRHGDLMASVEVRDAEDRKPLEEFPADALGASPAAKALPQAAWKALGEVYSSVESEISESRADMKLHDVNYELFLNPRAAGGLLEIVQGFTEPALQESLRIQDEVVPHSRSAVADEHTIDSENKSIGHIFPAEGVSQEFLFVYPMVTGGLLEVDVLMLGRATVQGKRTELPHAKIESEETWLEKLSAVGSTVPQDQASTSYAAKGAFPGLAVAPCKSDIDVCGILGEKLAPASSQFVPFASSRELSDDQRRTQPGDIPVVSELPNRGLGETEFLDEVEREPRAVFNTDNTGTTHFAFRVGKRSLIDSCSQTQLPSSVLKRTLSWTPAENFPKTPTKNQVNIGAGIPFDGLQYNADGTALDTVSRPSKIDDHVTDFKDNSPSTSQNAVEIELGFVPSADVDVPVTDLSDRSDRLPSQDAQQLSSIESGVLPAPSFEYLYPSDAQLSDSMRKGHPPELQEPSNGSEGSGGRPARASKPKPEKTEDLDQQICEQVGDEKALNSQTNCVDSIRSTLADGVRSFSDPHLPQATSNMIQKKETSGLDSPITSEYQGRHATDYLYAEKHETPFVEEQQALHSVSTQLAEPTTLPVVTELEAVDNASKEAHSPECRKGVCVKDNKGHAEVITAEKYGDPEAERSVSNIEAQVTETTKEASLYVDTEASTGREVLEVVPKENELSSEPAVPVVLADEASRATAVDHKLPVADECTGQSNVAAAESEPKIADKARIVEATNAGEKLGQTPEKGNRPEEPIAQSKALLTVDQDVEPLVPENFDRHEHSSSASTERDKTVSLAESEDFLPEGIPDPVASLVGFFEEHRSSQTALQSTERPYTTSEGPQKRHSINNAIEPSNEQDHLSKLSKEYKAQTDVIGMEAVTSEAECWRSLPEVKEEDALPEGESVTAQHPSVLKGYEDTEKLLNTGGRHTGETSHFVTEPKPSTGEKDGATACTELAENKPHSFTNGQSADGADGWHSPPGVREGGALPRDENTEEGKNEAFKHALHVLPKEEEKPIAEVVPSAVGTKLSPRENDVHLTGVPVQKPPPSANDHTVAVAEGQLESPLGVAEEQAVPGDASAVSPEHNRQQEGVEGFVNVLPIEEEKHITEKVSNASEANTSIGEKDVKLQSTEVAERKPSTSATEGKEGWQSPPAVTEEQAVPVDASEVSPEHKRQQEGVEDLAKALTIENEIHITEKQYNTSEANAPVGEKDGKLQSTEDPEHMPSTSATECEEGWQLLPAETEQALPVGASEVSPGQNKQEGVEGFVNVLPIEEGKHIAEEVSKASEANTSIGEKDVKLQSTEVAERKQSTSASEGKEGWQSPPGVTEEQAVPVNASEVSPEHNIQQEGVEDLAKALTFEKETHITEKQYNTSEANAAVGEKDGKLQSTGESEHMPSTSVTECEEGRQLLPAVTEQALPVGASEVSPGQNKQEGVEGFVNVLPIEEEKHIAEEVSKASEANTSIGEKDVKLQSTEVAERKQSTSATEGKEGWQSPPGVTEEQAVPVDASKVSPEHNIQQEGVEDLRKALPIEKEKHITEKGYNASEANISIGEKNGNLQSTGESEHMPSTSAMEGTEGCQSPPEVAEKDAILENANDVSGTAKVLHNQEQERITEVLPSAVKAKSSSGENDTDFTNMVVSEQKPPPESDQSLVGVEGWQSAPGGTKQQALPEDASAVSPERDKRQGGVEGSAKLLPIEQEHIDEIPSNAAEGSTSIGEKDVNVQRIEPSTEERKVEGGHSPPGVTEEQATLEDASVVSGTAVVLHTEEQKPIAEVLHSAAETESSRRENDASLTSTEVSEWKGPPSASNQPLVMVEGSQSPPGVTEQQALPNPSAVSPQRGIQERGVEGFAEVSHIEEERRTNEIALDAAEASMSIEEKNVKMQNTELSANEQSSKGVERRQSAPVLTEQHALSEYTSAASPAHGKEERPEGTAPALHIEEEKHTLEKPLSTAVETSFTAEKSADFQSAETSERKPSISANDQSMCRAVGAQSLPGAPKEEAHTVDVIAVPAEDVKQERVEGNEDLLDTRDQNDITVALPSEVPGEKCGEASSTELAVHKPCSGRVESTVVVDGWQSPSAVVGEDALPEDENVSHDLQLRSLSSERSEGEKVATVTERMTYQRVVGELKETQSLSRQLKRKAKARREHDGAKPEARTFKFNTQSVTSDNPCMLDNLNTGFMFTTIKSASSSTGSALCRREKTDITDEEVVYSSSGSNSPCGQLTSVKKSSSCCLVMVDYEDEESSPTTVRPRPASPTRQYYLDFTANFQQGQVVPYTGDVQKLRAPGKITNIVTSNDDEDSSPSRRSDKKARRAKQDAHAREPCDPSTYPSCPNVPSKSSKNCDSDSSTSRLPGTDYSYSATCAPMISPPHHDTEVQSLLCCKLCGQSFFRSDPTHAELCSSYHRDAALPAATSGVPPTAQFLEKYVLSVVDEDDVSDVLRQAWRDEETAILASSVWTLYRCVPSAFYIIREKEKRPTSRGDVCASACVITFGDEVSFCGFFHVSRERANEGLSRMLWARMLEACQGKNMCTVMPQERAQPFLDRYHFHVSYWGDIVYCHITLSRDSFPASSASSVGVLVSDLDLKRDSEAVIEYDRGVFGFDRSYYLRVALAEGEQMVKVATATSSEGHVKVVGYAGIQTDQRGRPALRWLLADGDEVARALMHAVVEACPKIREKGLVGVFYAASHATGVILNNVDKDFIEPWALLYNKREPFFRYDKIVSLTHI